MGERNCPRCGSAVPEGDPCRCADTAAPTGPGESPPAAGSDAADPDATETDATETDATETDATETDATETDTTDATETDTTDATETDTTDAEAADPGAPPRQVTPDHPAQLPTADPRDWDDALFAEHTLLLGHGERLQRVYPLVQRRRFRGAVEAQIMLTDARLLYRARARSPLRRSTVNREIELSQVRGFSVHQGRGIPVGTLLPLLVFLVVTVLVVTGLLAWLNSWLTEPIYFALAEDPRFVPGRGYRPYPNAANEIPAMPFYVPLLAFVSGVAAPLLIGWMLFVLGQLSLSRQTVLAVDLIGASGPVALTGPAEHPTTPLGTSLISQLRRHSAFWGALDASDVSPVVDRGQAQKVADEVGAYLQNLR